MSLRMPTDLSPLSVIDLFAQLRESLIAADSANEQAENHKAIDEADQVSREILGRPDAGWHAFVPFLDDPQPIMRLQAALAVKDHDIARVIPDFQRLESERSRTRG